jgi:TetR/AcrR family transcriptional regulator, tetracycline repressor protein
MIRPMGDPGRAEASLRGPSHEPAPGRAAWGTISREEIVAAAAEMVAAGGYEEMSIRSLAASLGVAPMSLYRHIRDKDDLLAEVTDRFLASAWRPAAAEADWQPWVIEAASKLRDFLVSQPAALHVYLGHPVVSPAAVERMNAMMSVLRRAGLSEEAARSAYGALHTYTIGFAALEASRARSAPGSRTAGSEDTVGEDVGLSHRLAVYTTTGQFIQGLHYMLQGISSLCCTRGAP